MVIVLKTDYYYILVFNITYCYISIILKLKEIILNRKEVNEIKKYIIGLIFTLTISLAVNIPNIFAQVDNTPTNPDNNLRDNPNLVNPDNNYNDRDNNLNGDLNDNDNNNLNEDLNDNNNMDDLDNDVVDNDLYENIAYGVGGIAIGALATYFLKRER